MTWRRILAYITGTVDEELRKRNEYLAAENRILRSKLPKRSVAVCIGRRNRRPVARRELAWARRHRKRRLPARSDDLPRRHTRKHRRRHPARRRERTLRAMAQPADRAGPHTGRRALDRCRSRGPADRRSPRRERNRPLRTCDSERPDPARPPDRVAGARRSVEQLGLDERGRDDGSLRHGPLSS